MKPLEKDLIKRLKKKERAAFIEFYKEYRDRLLYFLLRYTGNYEIAKDIAHETILRVAKKIGTYDHKAAFSSWIFRIAINLANDEFRRRKNRMEISLDPLLKAEEKEEKSPLIKTLSSQAPGPDTIAAKKEREKQLHEMINSLPFIYKEVLLLHEIEGYSYKKIGEIMNCSEKNVGVRLARARKMLMDKIKKRAPHLIPKIKRAEDKENEMQD